MECQAAAAFRVIVLRSSAESLAHPIMETEPKYPPAPWRLTGSAVVSVQLARARTARIPPELKVLRVWPGMTVGGIYLARYGPGSTLEYGELIVFSAVVRAGGRVGGWVSHIYVDSAESMAGGREIWGLPKELAEFEWGSETVTVRQGETTLLRTVSQEKARGLTIGGPLAAFGIKDGVILHFSARCRARIRRLRARWTIPPESPLAGLGLGRGWTFALSDLSVIVPPPASGTARGSGS